MNHFCAANRPKLKPAGRIKSDKTNAGFYSAEEISTKYYSLTVRLNNFRHLSQANTFQPPLKSSG